MKGSRKHTNSDFFYAEKVTVKFGGLAALKNVTIEVGEKEIRGLIGPNGAGKTTFFNVISGYILSETGKIFFQGEDITNFKPYEIAEKGIIRNFQKRNLVPHLSVLENVLTGCHKLMNAVRLWDICFRSRRFKLIEEECIFRAMKALKAVGLPKDVYYKGGTDLSFGQQTLVEIARALVSEPKLLLLDEPVAGLGSKERKNVLSILKKLPDEQGISLLLSDHVMEFVMEICENITVLNFGEILTEGSADYIREHEGVTKAYLGEKIT